MYFTNQLDTSADLAHLSVMYFSAGFLWGPGPLYVPTDNEVKAAAAEYTALIVRAPELTNPELDKALSSAEVARAALLTEIDRQASAFEQTLNKDMYFTSVLGFRCNGDRRTKENLQDLVNFGPDNNVQYRDYDNQLRILNKEQLKVLLLEHITNGQNLYAQKWALQNLVNSAQGFDGLHNVKISFTMMDFTKQTMSLSELARGA